MQKSGYYKFIEQNDAYRRLSVRNVVVGGAVFVAAGVVAFNATHHVDETSAADLSKFQAGYIMSDYVMTNSTSMTEAEIQAFLKSKNSCKDTDVAKATQWKDYSYHIENGHFVCMADETFDNIETGKKETAAHIIWQAAQDFKINPQVLIVLLQKEQGLVTDTWPNSLQYRSATGFGCPDTAACDTKYYGFRNQVRNAAKLFHEVMSGGWTNYPLGNNYILYNPNSACGGSVVNIQNRATSALYRYTPYQPNQAALAAYTGVANCGAYGNRNFYIYFEDWFGSTTATADIVTAEKAPDPIFSEFKDYASKMGDMVSDYKTVAIGKKSITAQEFKNGVLVSSNKKVYQLPSKICKMWLDNAATLGLITSALQSNPKTGMQWYDFENGKLVGNDTKGWFLSYGKSRKVWQDQGFESGKLGFPTSNIQSNPKTGMQWQIYEGGYVVGNDQKGWFLSMGGSRKVWEKLDFERGPLGFPTSNFQTNPKTGIWWQDYEGGKIVGNDQKGWYESRGNIRAKWQASGFESGRYGFPTSNIVNGRQNYEGGVIWQ